MAVAARRQPYHLQRGSIICTYYHSFDSEEGDSTTLARPISLYTRYIPDIFRTRSYIFVNASHASVASTARDREGNHLVTPPPFCPIHYCGNRNFARSEYRTTRSSKGALIYPTVSLHSLFLSFSFSLSLSPSLSLGRYRPSVLGFSLPIFPRNP